MTDTFYLDDFEIQDQETREINLFKDLRRQIDHAKNNTIYYANSLKNIKSTNISDRQQLSKLPILRKNSLVDLQNENQPFGGLLALPIDNLYRIFTSPGPIYEPQFKRQDYWRLARALCAAGFNNKDIVHNSFSYHLTPAGAMLESAAHSIGCPVIPAGTGNTEQQLQIIEAIKPSAYTGIPDYLKVLLDKGEELDRDVSSIKKALVSGAALPENLRGELESRGISIQQCYATAELGLISYETNFNGKICEGMMIAEDIIVEIVRPGTGDLVSLGEVGEVVVTTLKPEYPLIRFATGDLSAALPGNSPCGRTNTRIKGWMGRADQTTKIKGMFVSPQQVDIISKRHPEILRSRLVVARDDQQDIMTLKIECISSDSELLEAISSTLTSVTKLKGNIELMPNNSLDNDGMIIDDRRDID
ncbi:MAG: AMP-binding protein [Alphaproteobacteria bacterium]|jgi:phenylacetate-CoA ligase|nr:AMP-binding protein [Alphaproteobacteria bacterium]